jgi:hypothetical protein
MFSDPVARLHYAQIGSIEEQHVTQLTVSDGCPGHKPQSLFSRGRHA